jgi:hypothetical protein
MSSSTTGGRRGFLNRLLTMGGFVAAAPVQAPAQSRQSPPFDYLPKYARAQNYRSLKQSSFDTTGGNADYWPIKAGETKEVFNQQGPGVISHIWYTIAAQGRMHLKELVMRVYYDGNSKPSIETPVGDFFGLNLGDYTIYESQYLACSPGKSLNSYFSMPYRKSSRITITNQGERQVGAFYSNIDFMTVPSLPDDVLYLHAQYRQAAPNPEPGSDQDKDKNPNGKYNYVFAETRGRGHLMGVTLGVLQNSENWMGEGDDMIFVDDETKPIINGTGSEDYFLGSWDFGGRDGAIPFAHRMYGAQAISAAERIGGRYLCYRWHGDNPVTFNRYMKHTIEHGHANDRNDNFFSCCYWYQSEPFTDFPALPPVSERTPMMKVVNQPTSAR